MLLHGFPLDRTIWRPQINALSGSYQIVTPDLRGHGKSKPMEGPYTMDLLAEDVNRLLDSLRLDQVTLGGLSMGGYVVLAFYRKFPQRVRALILVDTRAEADDPEARARREHQALSVLKNGSRELVDQLIVKMFTEKTFRDQPKLVDETRKMMESTSPAGIAGALRGMALRPDSTAMLASIKVPTLILVGSNDSITTVADAQKMAQRIPGSELVVVPEAAHLTTLERPHEVNTALRRFLNKVHTGQTFTP